MSEEDAELIVKEFHEFSSGLADKIMETKQIPDYPFHSFKSESLSKIIPEKELKWRIGRTILRSLKKMDKALVCVLKNNEKYDFEFIDFFCFSDTEGNICFEAKLLPVRD